MNIGDTNCKKVFCSVLSFCSRGKSRFMEKLYCNVNPQKQHIQLYLPLHFVKKALAFSFNHPISLKPSENFLMSIKNWMGPYQRTPKEVARAIRFSGLGVRSVGPVGDFLDHGNRSFRTGFPWVPASWQELGHGPFDGPFSFFPGMAMSIAGSGDLVRCVCGFFFGSRRRCSTRWKEKWCVLPFWGSFWVCQGARRY